MNNPTFMIDAWDFSAQSPVKIELVSEFQSQSWYHCQRSDEHLATWFFNRVIWYQYRGNSRH